MRVAHLLGDEYRVGVGVKGCEDTYKVHRPGRQGKAVGYYYYYSTSWKERGAPSVHP